MLATRGTIDPDDESIERRDAVFARVEAGTPSIVAAAAELGISASWASQLRTARRQNHRDPAVLRKHMLARLETDEGRAHYAERKITTEPVFGNIKANLRHRRFSGRGMSAARSGWRLILLGSQPVEGQD